MAEEQLSTLDPIFSEEKLLVRAESVGKEWKKLALNLGFSWIQVSHYQLNARNQKISETVFIIFDDWAKAYNGSHEKLLKTLDSAIARAKSSITELRLPSRGLSDDLFLYNVGECLGNKWKELGTVLLLDQSDLENVAADCGQNQADAAMEMLIKWRNTHTGKAECFSQLIKSLKLVGLNDLAHQLQAFRQQNIDPKNLNFTKTSEGKLLLLGSGMKGDVFQAVYTPICEQVAVKVLHSGTTLPDNMQKALWKEVKNMMEIRHKHTVNIYGVLQDDIDHRYGIVMEMMPNGTLREALEEHFLPWSLKLGFATSVCSGMAYLHSKEMIHRDLKAANILLDSDFKARISDFGLAKFASATVTSTKPHKVGTPTHMAPEMFNPGQEKSYPVDVYSFGIVLFELAAENQRNSSNPLKRLPFLENTTELEIGFMLVLLKQCPINEEHVAAKIPSDCPEIIMSLMTECCSIDPTSRQAFSEILPGLLNYCKSKYASIYEEDLKNLRQSRVARTGAETNNPNEATNTETKPMAAVETEEDTTPDQTQDDEKAQTKSHLANQTSENVFTEDTSVEASNLTHENYTTADSQAAAHKNIRPQSGKDLNEIVFRTKVAEPGVRPHSTPCIYQQSPSVDESDKVQSSIPPARLPVNRKPSKTWQNDNRKSATLERKANIQRRLETAADVTPGLSCISSADLKMLSNSLQRGFKETVVRTLPIHDAFIALQYCRLQDELLLLASDHVHVMDGHWHMTKLCSGFREATGFILRTPTCSEMVISSMANGLIKLKRHPDQGTWDKTIISMGRYLAVCGVIDSDTFYTLKEERNGGFVYIECYDKSYQTFSPKFQLSISSEGHHFSCAASSLESLFISKEQDKIYLFNPLKKLQLKTFESLQRPMDSIQLHLSDARTSICFVDKNNYVFMIEKESNTLLILNTTGNSSECLTVNIWEQNFNVLVHQPLAALVKSSTIYMTGLNNDNVLTLWKCELKSDQRVSYKL